MKKIVRNLLMGVATSFWPVEKASAEFSILDFPEFLPTEEKRKSPAANTENLDDPDKIVPADSPTKNSLVGTDQVNECLDLLENFEVTEEQVLDSNVVTNAEVMTDFAVSETNQVQEVAFSPLADQQNTANEMPEDQISMTNETNSEQITNEVLSVSEPMQTKFPETQDINSPIEPVSISNSVPESVEEGTTIQSEKDDAEEKSTEPVVFETTENKKETEIILVEKSQSVSGKTQSAVPVKQEKIPSTGNKWFLFLSAFGLGGLLATVFSLGNKIDSWLSKKRKQEKKSSDVSTQTPEHPQEVVVQKPLENTLSNAPGKQDAMPKNILPVENISDDSKAYQKGIRMLANVQVQRKKINARLRVLKKEMEKYQQSTAEWKNIVNEITALSNERSKLAIKARQARTLIKGKQGQLLQNERRLLAKELRLIKKTDANNFERIKTVFEKRAKLKEAEIQLLKHAKIEIKERQEAADRWHGIRLFREVKVQEKELQDKIKLLKKETGLKKKEILEADDGLNAQDKAIKVKKSLARKKSKGACFAITKRHLAKEIIIAHNNSDVETENFLKEKLASIKQREKDYIKQAETFDYLGQRKIVLSPAVIERMKVRQAKEAERRKAIALHKKRVRMAQLLRGQRMLRDLSAGQVESVSLNQRSAADYKKEALSLIGKKRVLIKKNERFV